jgi:hypothetical protein
MKKYLIHYTFPGLSDALFTRRARGGSARVVSRGFFRLSGSDGAEIVQIEPI